MVYERVCVRGFVSEGASRVCEKRYGKGCVRGCERACEWKYEREDVIPITA